MQVIIQVSQLAFPAYDLIQSINNNASHGIQIVTSFCLLKDALNNKEHGLLRSVRFD